MFRPILGHPQVHDWSFHYVLKTNSANEESLVLVETCSCTCI